MNVMNVTKRFGWGAAGAALLLVFAGSGLGTRSTDSSRSADSAGRPGALGGPLAAGGYDTSGPGGETYAALDAVASGTRLPASESSDVFSSESSEEPAGPVAENDAQLRAEVEQFAEFARAALVELRAGWARDAAASLELRRRHLDAVLTELEEELPIDSERRDRFRTLVLEGLDRELEYVRVFQAGGAEADLDRLIRADEEALAERLAGFLGRDEVATFQRWWKGQRPRRP